MCRARLWNETEQAIVVMTTTKSCADVLPEFRNLEVSQTDDLVLRQRSTPNQKLEGPQTMLRFLNDYLNLLLLADSTLKVFPTHLVSAAARRATM